MPVFMQNKAQLLTKELSQAVDIDNNVIDEDRVLEIIVELESTVLTTEDLRVTRLGRHINEIRRKTSNTEISRRAKELVKAWRGFVNEAQKQDSNHASTTVNCNGINASSHSLNNKITVVNGYKNDFSQRKRKLSQTNCASHYGDDKQSETVFSNNTLAADKKPPPLPKLVLLLNRKVNGTTTRCITRPATPQSPSVQTSVALSPHPPAVIKSVEDSSSVKRTPTRPSKVSTTLDLLAKIQADQSAFKEAYQISRQQAVQLQQQCVHNESHEKPRKRMRRTRKPTNKLSSPGNECDTRSLDSREEDNALSTTEIKRINEGTAKGWHRNKTIEMDMKQNESESTVLSHDSNQERIPSLANKNDNAVVEELHSGSEDSDVSASESRFTLCPDEDLVSNIFEDSEWRTISIDLKNESSNVVVDNEVKDSDQFDLDSILIKPSVFGGIWDPDYERIMTESGHRSINTVDDGKNADQQQTAQIDGSKLQDDFQDISSEIEKHCYIKIMPYLSNFSSPQQDELEISTYEQMDQLLKCIPSNEDDKIAAGRLDN